MEDIVVAILAIAVGALFCFRGHLTMRVIIPLWGAFAGFVLGASLVAAGGDSGFLQSVAAWLVGAAVAMVFGLLAYTYFEVSVVLAMSAIGFAIGTSVMVAIGVKWSWLIILVGIAAGTVLAIVAIAGDLPTTLLTVLTAMAGASTIVGGIMLLTGDLNTDQVTETGVTTDVLHDDWWWYAIYGGLVVAGIVSQISATNRMRGSMREAWEASKHPVATS